MTRGISGAPPAQGVFDGGRYRELDGLRGIAAISVVIYHNSYLFDFFFPGHAAMPIKFIWGGYGVPLFFMISGYVILMTARRSRRPRDFVISRFSRLYPVYWAAMLFTALVVGLLRVPHLGVTAREFLVNVTMLQYLLRVRSVDGSYWSLSIELVFYGIIFCVLAAAKKITDRHVNWVVGSWLFFSTAVGVLSHVSPTKLIARLSIVSGAEYAAFFAIGMYCYLTRTQRRFHLQLLPVALIAGLNGWLFTGAITGLVYVGLTIAFILITMADRVPLLTWLPIAWLGDISYPPYLVHQYLGYTVQYYLVDRIGRIASFCVAVALAISVAYLLHITVEKKVSSAVRRRLTAPFSPRPVAFQDRNLSSKIEVNRD